MRETYVLRCRCGAQLRGDVRAGWGIVAMSELRNGKRSSAAASTGAAGVRQRTSSPSPPGALECAKDADARGILRCGVSNRCSVDSVVPTSLNRRIRPHSRRWKVGMSGWPCDKD